MTKKDGNPVVILLVEDDPGDQELTRRVFEDGNFDCSLRVVGDGEEAMDYLMRRGEYTSPTTSPRPDLILLDFNLPKLNGIEVLKQVRADPEICQIPIIVLTTSNQDCDVRISYKEGANSFITKPVDMGQFIDVVKVLGEYWFGVVALPPEAK